jgi:hypothetical protein
MMRGKRNHAGVKSPCDKSIAAANVPAFAIKLPPCGQCPAPLQRKKVPKGRFEQQLVAKKQN